MAEEIGALVVVYKNGTTSTYRWIKVWDFNLIAKRDLQTAAEQLARAKRLRPSVEADAKKLVDKEFRKKYEGIGSEELLRMLESPVGVSTMTRWSITTLPLGIQHLEYVGALEINFGEVRSVKFTEVCSI